MTFVFVFFKHLNWSNQVGYLKHTNTLSFTKKGLNENNKNVQIKRQIILLIHKNKNHSTSLE